MNKIENPGEVKQDENLDKNFTVKEVANFLEETPNVIRNWFKEFRDYIPHEKNSSGYNVYKKEGIEAFRQIKALHREQNWSMKQVEHYFATGGESFKPEPEKQVGEVIAEELRALRKEMKALREDNQDIKDQLEKQERFNKALVDQLQQIERGSLERHNTLTESLKGSLEKKKLIAAAIENPDTNLDNQVKKPKRKGIFSFLWGKEE